MSRSVGRASGEGQDDPEPVSVLDFLYHDAQRVASFLSQFDASGILTGIKQTESTESGETSRAGASASGTVAIARAGTSFEDQRSSGEKEQLERAYDPIWANAIELLGLLDSKGLIEREISTAAMGQFVCVSGALAVFDYAIMKLIWQNAVLRPILEKGMQTALQANIPAQMGGNQDRQQKAQAALISQEVAKNAKGIVQLLSDLPHTIQARLSDSSGRIFSCSLREQGIIGSSADLLLKHGTMIKGVWNIVGILDALPDDSNEVGQQNALTSGLISGAFSQAINSLAILAREVGRPATAYGVTPLVIYRTTVSGQARI